MKRCVRCWRPLEYGAEYCPGCGCRTVPFCIDGHLLSPGAMIADRYLVGEENYSGGSSIVYKSFDTVSGRIIAIKEFFVGSLMSRNEGGSVLAADEKNTDRIDFRRGRFLREAKMLSKLRFCRGVPEVYDCIFENGTVYIVSQWIDGQRLADRISDGNYSADGVLSFAERLLDSVQAIHEKGVIHRDLSPDNIILLDGSLSDPFVVDFGESVGNGAVRAEKVRILKAGFSSPEERMGKDISVRSDIWSAAAVLYTLIFGKKPNDYITFCGIPNTVFPDDYPESFINALRTALDPDPEKRFSTAADFAKAAGLKSGAAKKVRRKKPAVRNTVPCEIDYELPDTPELSPGTLIAGRYLISSEWEKSGSCYVYKAYDRILGRNVSVSELFQGEMCRRDRDGVGVKIEDGHEYAFFNLIELFEREAKKNCSCSSGRGLSVTESFFRENGTAYSVSEYLADEPFGYRLAPKNVIEKMKPVYMSLSELHSKGGIHGNVSYSNLRMREDGSLCLCYPGTVYSPENRISIPDINPFAKSKSPDDERISAQKLDDYSFAALLYRLLCGHEPADTAERAEAERLGREDPLVSPRKYCRWVTEEESGIIMKALNRRNGDNVSLDRLFAKYEI